MEIHIAIVWDRKDETLYAVPGRVLATYGDTIVVHAVNRCIELSAPDPSPFGKPYHKLWHALNGLIPVGKSFTFKVPGKRYIKTGIYGYRAYSPDEKVYAVAGSYPKVIIYD
jgi:hypothetical protein